MTKPLDSTLRAQIKALPHLETVTTPNTTYHVVGRYTCDVCGQPAQICIRDRGRDLYSRCGCGVDARPALVIQRARLERCRQQPASQQQPAPAQPAPLPIFAQEQPAPGQSRPRNLLEYLLNMQVINLS